MRCLPHNVLPHPALTFSAAVGSCSQSDALVGGSWICGEITAGAVVAGRSRWRGLFELGGGVTKEQSWGYPSLGLGEATGGWYVAPRGLVGYDWTTLFFTALGVQARITDPYHQFFQDVGKGGVLQHFAVQGLFETGTSVVSQHIEVALRVGVGQERVFSEAPGLSSWSSGVLAIDTLLVTRVLLSR